MELPAVEKVLGTPPRNLKPNVVRPEKAAIDAALVELHELQLKVSQKLKDLQAACAHVNHEDGPGDSDMWYCRDCGRHGRPK